VVQERKATPREREKRAPSYQKGFSEKAKWLEKGALSASGKIRALVPRKKGFWSSLSSDERGRFFFLSL